MLCLKLKPGEEAVVTHNGEQMRVVVLRVLGDRGEVNIRLGFEAPMSFNIVRKEVIDRKGG